jgi:hypothetical protein
MNYDEAHALIDHPARDGWLRQAREDNPDLEQRDAARVTLIRMAGGESLSLPAMIREPSHEDIALRAYVVKHGCCGH